MTSSISSSMGTRSHKNAPLTPEGRRRLVERCRTRPIAHVAAEMGISRATASKWVNRYRKFGELGLLDRSSAPVRQSTATPGQTVARTEQLRREKKWSASRIAFELHADGTTVSRRTITRHLAQLGLNRRRFIDPNGENPRDQDHHRQASRAHGAPGREEGRAHPRRRRLASAREEQPRGQGRRPREDPRRASGIRIPTLCDRSRRLEEQCGHSLIATRRRCSSRVSGWPGRGRVTAGRSPAARSSSVHSSSVRKIRRPARTSSAPACG